MAGLLKKYMGEDPREALYASTGEWRRRLEQTEMVQAGKFCHDAVQPDQAAAEVGSEGGGDGGALVGRVRGGGGVGGDGRGAGGRGW